MEILLGSDEEPKVPKEASQSPGQAPPSPDYVPGPEHPPSLDYVPGPKEPEQEPPSPDYVPEPEYPEYLVPSDAKTPIKDQPLLDDASPTTLSPGYIADSYLEEDPEEDPADYPANRGHDDNDESFDDDDDDDVKEDQEEEHLAPADSFASAPIPPSPRPRKARISVRLPSPMAASMEARIAEYAVAPTSPSPPPSPLTPLSSPLPYITSPLLPVPSPPLPLPSPTHTSPAYVEAPLGYRAAGIRLRAASPPLLLPSTTHIDDLPEADIPLRKRACFTTTTGRFEVGESLLASAARQTGHTLAHRIDYGFVDTLDASIRASESRAMTADAHDDRALLRAQVSLLTREGMYFRSMTSSYEREAAYSRQALAHSESRSQTMEAQIRALRRDVDVLQRYRIRDEDRLTSHIQHDHDRFKDLVRAADAGPHDGPADAGSS
ncbi:hypothetical protein Tco_0594084, partial [Tanacetum coccineum]